jgi:hypothetical protein
VQGSWVKFYPELVLAVVSPTRAWKLVLYLPDRQGSTGNEEIMADEDKKFNNEGQDKDSKKSADETKAQPDAPGKKADTEQKFTQAELDDIVQGRLSKKEAAIAKELGMDIEAAKAKLKAMQDVEDNKKSAIDKLQEELAAMKKQAETERERAARIKRESQIKDIAVELNFNDPSDAITFLDNEKFEYDDDGNITNAKKLLTELAENKKYLIREQPFQNPANPGSGRKPKDENERLKEYGYHIPKR